MLICTAASTCPAVAPVPERGDVTAGFAQAGVVVEGTFTTPGNTNNPLGLMATLASWHGDTLTVHDSTQWPHNVRTSLADLGARTPEGTALSIAAEIVAARQGGSGLPLTSTRTPIHHDTNGVSARTVLRETPTGVLDAGSLRAGGQVREKGAQSEISNPAPLRRISKAPWPGR